MIAARIQVYKQVVKTQIIRSMAYKFQVYGNILMQCILMLAGAFFWKALFKNSDNIQGVNVDTMLVYTVVSSMISVFLTTGIERRIITSVEKGTIAIDMMRPVNIFSVFLAEDIAGVIALIFQNLLPILLIGSIMIGFPMPHSLEGFILFLISIFMAFWINWFIAACFGMIAFWTINMDAFVQVKKHLIRLLSGSIIPLWFFPEGIRKVLEWLPFTYLYQLPLDIYIGKYNNGTLVRGLLIQSGWLLGLLILFLFLQKRVTGKVMIQGV